MATVKMDAALFERAKHEWIRIGDLRPHPKVQRSINSRWVAHLSNALDPDRFGELAVVRQGTHDLVIDGQHRLEAARAAWGDGQRVPCVVYADLPLERQAQLFLGRNDRLGVKVIDKWEQRLLAKDETALAVERVLGRHEMRTHRSRGEGVVQAVAALERVFSRVGDAGLDRVIGILREAWGRDPDAFDGLLLRGVGALTHRFNGELDDRELARKLQREGGPGRVIGQARDLAKAAGTTTERAMLDRLVAVANKGRRSNRLEV